LPMSGGSSLAPSPPKPGSENSQNPPHPKRIKKKKSLKKKRNFLKSEDHLPQTMSEQNFFSRAW
jgi:hypothetical protein